jgi:phage FluMu protein Com
MININGKEYKEIRCYKCQAFIIYANISAGIMFYQCPKCGFANEFTFKFLKTKDNITEISKKFSIEGR